MSSITSVDDYHDPSHASFSGSGDTETDSFALESRCIVFVYDHGGDDTFSIELVRAESGESLGRIVHVFGNTSGAQAVLGEANDFMLNVSASGEWSVAVAQPASPDSAIHRLPVESSGSGSDVIGPVELPGSTLARATHSGQQTFQVGVIDEDGYRSAHQAVVVNDSGQVDAETTFDYSGLVWVTVAADGDWTLDFERA